MRIDILTLFPEMFAGPFTSSVIKRAIDRGLLRVELHNIRDYTHDRHHVVDDTPYGGGAGMVLKPEPVFEAVESVQGMDVEKAFVILMTPAGRPFNHALAAEYSQKRRLILIAGHYEGFDERVTEITDDQVSIGDYVLSGGELPAMVVTDAVARLVPGVLGSADSHVDESHNAGLLEYPHYTRPPEFRGMKVPPILLSGNHAEIARWRRRRSLERTLERRPDLLTPNDLSDDDQRLLAEKQQDR